MQKAVRLRPAQSITLKRRKHDTGMKYLSEKTSCVDMGGGHKMATGSDHSISVHDRWFSEWRRFVLGDA